MIYIGGKKYVGLGTTKDGLTLDEIKQWFVSEFNKPFDPLLDGIVTQEQLHQMLAAQGRTVNDLVPDEQIQGHDVPGIDLEHVQEFRLDRIEEVLKIEPDQLTPDKINSIFPELKMVDLVLATAQ